MKILTFGEVLFDVFENKTVIGGAPLNFCAHFTKLGGKGYILSAVGNDALGKQAADIIKSHGVNTEHLGKSDFPTGVCNVTYNEGEPSYDLSQISAYDDIALDENELRKIAEQKFDIFYFGTLAQRETTSKNTVDKILKLNCFNKVFFDMNLRRNYFSAELVKSALHASDIVKINRSELEYIRDSGLGTDEKDICKKYEIELLLVTLDKDGMVLYESKNDKVYRSPKPKNKVVSTVGAGDASSACFLYNYLRGEKMQACVDRANEMGDYIVTFTEAIPEYSEELIKKIK